MKKIVLASLHAKLMNVSKSRRVVCQRSFLWGMHNLQQQSAFLNCILYSWKFTGYVAHNIHAQLCDSRFTIVVKRPLMFSAFALSNSKLPSFYFCLVFLFMVK